MLLAERLIYLLSTQDWLEMFALHVFTGARREGQLRNRVWIQGAAAPPRYGVGIGVCDASYSS